jgi:YHS domain-containing protein
MSKDPVCGMDVDQSTARAAGRMSEYQGKTYFFDFDQCKQNFDRKPESYVGKGAGTPKKPGAPASGSIVMVTLLKANAGYLLLMLRQGTGNAADQRRVAEFSAL